MAPAAVCLLSVLFTAACLWTTGQGLPFRLANVYGNDTVLQMEPKSVQIWGYSGIYADISVTLGLNTYYTSAGPDAKWRIRLPPQPAGGPHEITFTHKPASGDEETLVMSGVLFGDVWVCGGQDNMQFSMQDVKDSELELEKLENYTRQIRLLKIAQRSSQFEEEEGSVTTDWTKPTPKSAMDFSALCILFGERLADTLTDRPIGLIDTSWSGSPIEAWSSSRVTDRCNTPPSSGSGQDGNNAVWNGMISPLTNLAVRGAIFYQGEYNYFKNSDMYTCHFSNMIEDWRSSFVDGRVPVVEERRWSFPFGFVQFAENLKMCINISCDCTKIGPTGNISADNSLWGDLRWHQTMDLGLAPNQFLQETFMAASYDLTDKNFPNGAILFSDKQTVADRLANAAKHFLYSLNYPTRGPVAISVHPSKVDHFTVTVTYSEEIRSFGTSGFAYKMPNGEWVTTPIESSSNYDVTLLVETEATHLAYAWLGEVCEYKQCAVYSVEEELPAQPWIWDLSSLKHTYN